MKPMIVLGYAKTEKGSAKWAWSAWRLNAYLCAGGARTIVASSPRLVQWRSGNWSSQARRLIRDFQRRWKERELTPRAAMRLLRRGVPGSRQVRETLKAAQ